MTMQHLLSGQGEAALAELMARRPLLAFDFDGTLAPIVPRPEDAHASLAVVRRLEQLAQRRPVAIVTGRCIADVRSRLNFQPQYVVGNHGAEDPTRPEAEGWCAALDPLRERLRRHAGALRAAGVEVEDKRYSVALHYRLAPLPEHAAALVAPLLQAQGEATRVFGGKRVLNVMAAAAPDKGDAVVRLVRDSGSDCALYIGDDVNDEAVFERAPRHWLTVRVGREDAHSKAAFFLDTCAEVSVVLHRVLQLLEGGHE